MKLKEKQIPIVLIVVDGWGIAPASPGNAFTLAKTPNIDALLKNYPNCRLACSGEDVGLPKGQAGNSEVGHLNLGAGRIVYQDLPKINISIADGSFSKNSSLLKAITHVKENNSKLHLIGLAGLGGVHSYLEHLYALLWLCKEQQVESDGVYLHLFTDGRDSSPKSARDCIAKIENKCKALGIGKIASIAGRYYAMDRDNHWDRTQKTYELLTEGKAEISSSALETIEKSYKSGRTDEFITPTVMVDKNKKPLGLISDNDAVIFFNFRADRARQLTAAFAVSDFSHLMLQRMLYQKISQDYSHKILPKAGNTVTTFKRKKVLKNLFFVTMTQYDTSLPVSAIAFEPTSVDWPLAAIFSSKSLHQFHIAETEKYPHVTYFFNGRREDPFPYEDRAIIPSPSVPTYDLKPEMSAREVSNELLKRLSLNLYYFAIVNFANLDMVGHTGSIPAAINAVEEVDKCIGEIVKNTLLINGSCIVTSDHGNIENMINLSTGGIDTEHSINPVYCVIASKELKGKGKVLRDGRLSDVAPTILSISHLPKSQEMTGNSLFE